MKKRTDLLQGSPEWLQARCGKPSASEFDALVKKDFTLRDGEMPKTYLARLLTERWTGKPIFDDAPAPGSWAMQQGAMRETEARPWLELSLGESVEEVGLCTTDDGDAVCSPDGLIGDTGVEIKCPLPQTHCKYLLNNVVPDDYLPQIHFSMYVTGFKSWRFVSYSRKLPKLVIIVKRDETTIEKIHAALASFETKLDAAYAMLVKLNGGEPERFTPEHVTKGNGDLWRGEQ